MSLTKLTLAAGVGTIVTAAFYRIAQIGKKLERLEDYDQEMMDDAEDRVSRSVAEEREVAP